MLSYLVTSPARRRLLECLWREGGRGTASGLAAQSLVSFATAYRELQAMRRHDLVTQSWEDGVAVYEANQAHPAATALRALVVPAARPAPAHGAEADQVRARLAARGAPVRSEAEGPATMQGGAEDDVIAGVELARRDPATARALPVLLHRLAPALDHARIKDLARANGVSHELGFLLALTARLGGDRSLAALSRSLRDHRVRHRPFFLAPPGPRTVAFPLARAWGFTMTLPPESFADLFRRFVVEAPA